MNMISQLPQPARFESVGERRLPVQVPIVTYTLAERVQNAKIENAMIASITPRKKTRTEELFGDSRSNEQRTADSRAAILAHLDEPRTADQIAARLKGSHCAVIANLRKMMEAGMVTYTQPPRGPGGRPTARIWTKAQRANVTANIAKGNKTRTEVLALINSPVTTAELAAAYDRHPRHMRAILREMEKAGMIERAGFGEKPVKGAAPVLWVRA